MNKQTGQNGILKGAVRVWRGIDLTRRIILNIVFFVILFYVLSWWMSDDRPKVPDSTILVVSPYGNIVDQLRPFKLEDYPKRMVGMGPPPETLLKDLLDAIDAGKDDDRVKALFMDLDGLGGAGLTKLQDLGAAIERFKASGKKVIAMADIYGRNSYYLAAHADEIYLHRMGYILLPGYARYRRFYKDALDKLGVEVNIFKVGTYKAAIEPYFRNSMSEADKEASERWMGELWNAYLKDVSAARNIKIETINDYTEHIDERLKESAGDPGKTAKKAGLVDKLVTRDQVRKRLIELSGENKRTHSYYGINHRRYLEALARDRWGGHASGDVVGVVVAKGEILGGYQPPGTIGGESTARLIRKARQNENVKAIVLKVDSGGGSTFASEIIRRELEVAREQGKPVVISMSSVAASGGYWISLASDEIWAYPTTITGSIGIYAVFPTFQEPMKKYLGIRVDGFGTNRLAGLPRTDRKLPDFMKETLQIYINRGYNEFITKVAEVRKMTPEEVDKIAQGRVWIGSDALKLGLVDKLGTFTDALDSAAKLAKLGDDYKIKYFRRTPSARQKMIVDLLSGASGTGPGDDNDNDTMETPSLNGMQPFNPLADVMRAVAEQVRLLSRFNDPKGTYAFWMETVDF
ncbi:MAG: signal peptide peptidase SppA [bacterium]|nr:signal peptide peptidase SppA [bacterium]